MKNEIKPFELAATDDVGSSNAQRPPLAPSRSRVGWTCLLLLIAAVAARAGLSEPDNLIYGAIVIDEELVTSDWLDVVVEARRGTNGAAVASYRMGDNTKVNDLYYLRIPLESAAPLTDTNASVSGEILHVTVTQLQPAPFGIGDNLVVLTQQVYIVNGRGSAQRMDFGSLPVAPVIDTNGLPDTWEILHFGVAGQDPNALQANGMTILENYIAGTGTNEVFDLSISLIAGDKIVSFQGRAAAGPGYEGLTRHYSLESRTNWGDSWLGVPGYTNLLGSDAPISYTESQTVAPTFYRGEVWLE